MTLVRKTQAKMAEMLRDLEGKKLDENEAILLSVCEHLFEHYGYFSDDRFKRLEKVWRKHR